MNKAKNLLGVLSTNETVDEQKVIREESVLSEEQSAKVMKHLNNLNEEYHKLSGTLHECVHECEDHKKRKIHKMIDHVVERQKSLGLFHRTFKK